MYTGTFLTGFHIIVFQYAVIKRTTLLCSFFSLVAHYEQTAAGLCCARQLLLNCRRSHTPARAPLSMTAKQSVRPSDWPHSKSCAPQNGRTAKRTHATSHFGSRPNISCLQYTILTLLMVSLPDCPSCWDVLQFNNDNHRVGRL